MLAATLVAALPLGAQAFLHFNVQAPRVEPIAGLAQRVHGGELHLTLNEFLTLVLANDTQVHLLRLAEANASEAVLAAHSPFDPNLTASFRSNRSVQAQSSQTSGAATLSQLGQNTSLGYTQTLSTGQQVQLSFGASRNSSNSAFSTFNPSLGSNFSLSITQSLLRNRSNLQNSTGLLVAKTQLLMVGDQTQTNIADQLVTAADQYWATVEARDQITVQQDAVNLAQKSYERDEESLKLGALAPGDIFTSQAQVAQDQTALLQAQSNYKQQVDVLRRLIGADLDPTAKSATLVLDDDPSATTPMPPSLSVDQAVSQALRRRPELDALQRQDIEDNFNLSKSRDSLRPDLSLTGTYGSSGLAGNQVPVVTPLGTLTGGSTSGFGSALNQVFGFGAPTYGFTLSLQLPLKNSAGEAAVADSLISQTNDAYQLRNERQQVAQDVRLADTKLRMAVAVVQSATTARDLAQKNVDAEQQKYTLGSITVFELLQAQVQLSGAQSTLLSSYTNYQEAEIAYERATWTLLQKLNLTVR
ncbi:MAG: TolC family protein [Terriglobales bacterium]